MELDEKNCDVIVALLAEGVDRNGVSAQLEQRFYESPSSRRAWIEIYHCCSEMIGIFVALLAEGVDRNCYNLVNLPTVICRPPRGGRG